MGETRRALSYQELTAHSLIFQVLDESGRMELMQLAELESYAAGATILRQGDEGRHVYLVHRGQVRVWTEDQGAVVELGTLDSGVIFGEVAELGHVRRTASVEALGPVEVLRFDGPRLISLLKAYPAAERMLSRIVAHRAEDTIRKTLG